MMIEGLVISNGTTVESCLSKAARIEIPEGIHTIGPGAFKGCVSLVEVVLPQSLTHIRENAFKGCRKLQTINFPEHLEVIGDYAFHRCHSLLQVMLPASVEHLGNCVFLFCENLRRVSIPGVRSLGNQVFFHALNLECLEISLHLNSDNINDVFMGCMKLSEIRLTDGSSYTATPMLKLLTADQPVPDIVKAIVRDIYRAMEVEDGCLLKFLLNLTHVEIPEGIRELGKSSFFDKKGIISVTLPASLTHIDCRAFRNCINLETIILKNDNLTISTDAFKNCTTLRYVETADGQRYQLTGLGAAADGDMPEIVRAIHAQVLGSFFISGTMLMEYRGSEERVAVPAGITVIGERAFAGNEAIGRVILPDTVQEIHQEAFADCLMLQTINLPPDLKRLDEGAFENCVKLIRMELPDGLKRIGASAFNRCKSLNEIAFGSGLKQIDALAFYGCTAIRKLDFPEQLKNLGDMAFYKCSGLKEVVLPASLKRLGNNVFTRSGIRRAVVTANVMHWGTGVFMQCQKLRVLTLEEGVLTIGDRAAAECPALKYVNLPRSLTGMGYQPFAGSPFAAELKPESDGSVVLGTVLLFGQQMSGEVIVPGGITGIAGGAFHCNEAITAIVLPSTLRSIGTAAFTGCTGLIRLVLPEGIDEIEKETFAYCSSLQTVAAGARLKSVGESAFCGCSSLRQPAWTADLIGADAFADTAFLEEQRKQSGPVMIGSIVIDGQSCRGELVFAAGITGIAPFAFVGNEAITSVIFPESLKTVGQGAFYGCRNLTRINAGEGIGEIGPQAFGKCTSLKQLKLNAVTIGEQAFAFCTELAEVILTKASKLGKEAFAGCRQLMRFDGAAVSDIGIRCFEACESLPMITLNENTRIAAHAFESCSSLTKVQVLGRDIILGSYAFSGCTAICKIRLDGRDYLLTGHGSLSDTSLPDTVRTIYQSAISCFSVDEELCLFRSRSHGSTLHIPKGIREIGREVFRNAMQLANLTVPASVEKIGARAFHSTPWQDRLSQEQPLVIINDILVHGADCVGAVVIPETVKQIAGWAFANAYGLTSITFQSDRTSTGEYAFRNCINLQSITTADGQVWPVKHITDRSNPGYPALVRQIINDCYNCFKLNEQGILAECTGNISELVLPPGIAGIGAQVFKESNLLTHIRLSADTETIGAAAFEQCKWLTCVAGAEAIRRIEKQAFSGCGRLESIDLSDHLAELGPRAFEHCTSLKSMVIPEGVTAIPDKAFYRCRSLEYIKLPSTLNSIGKEAFAYCTRLLIPDIGSDVAVAGDAFRKAGTDAIS